VERVRWGNVAKLVGVLFAAALIAFWRGGSEDGDVVLPLDPLPGEAVDGATPTPRRSSAPQPPAPKPPPRRRKRSVPRKESMRKAGPSAWIPRAAAPASVAPPLAARPVPRRRSPAVPEVAREFSFDR